MPTAVFRVKVLKNAQHYNLYVGFTLHSTPLDDWQDFDKRSWLISTGRHQLYERGNWGIGKRDDIVEGSEVRVEKVFADRSLTFWVNDQMIHGKVRTNLQADEFAQLIGCVEFYYNGDAVEIITV